MIGSLILIIVFVVIGWYLVEYIKYFKTGDPNETEQSYWKFSYDFKPAKKEDYNPDNPDFLKRKRFRNRLIFLLYIDALIIFLLLNSFAAHILEAIVSQKFSYPI